jgi:glyoxylate/succinic semialdehyde reductase
LVFSDELAQPLPVAAAANEAFKAARAAGQGDADFSAVHEVALAHAAAAAGGKPGGDTA